MGENSCFISLTGVSLICPISATGDGGMQRGKVTKFISGDDLDDDFLMGETDGSKTKPSESKGDPASDFKTNNVKAKKKQVPKVVNFVG